MSVNIFPKPGSQAPRIIRDRWPKDFRNKNGSTGPEIPDLPGDENLVEHIQNMLNPHMYVDTGEDENYLGVVYRPRIIDGKLYMEVIANE